jgi:POT family proton-dependent oligopeptide transporter
VAAAVVVFRGAYEQVGNTVALWAEGTDRVLAGGWTIPMTWFQSLNPFLVFAMTPLLVASWTRAAAVGREPSAIQKMSRGAVIVGAAFVLLAAISAWSAASGTKVGWPWLAAYFLVLTIGELYILPVGLGLFGRLAPAGLSATAIALWFFAAFFGNLLAGGLGVLWSLLPSWLYFLLMAVVACAAGLLLRVFDKAIRRVDAPIPSSAQGTAV